MCSAHRSFTFFCTSSISKANSIDTAGYFIIVSIDDIDSRKNDQTRSYMYTYWTNTQIYKGDNNNPAPRRKSKKGWRASTLRTRDYMTQNVVINTLL